MFFRAARLHKRREKWLSQRGDPMELHAEVDKLLSLMADKLRQRVDEVGREVESGAPRDFPDMREHFEALHRGQLLELRLLAEFARSVADKEFRRPFPFDFSALVAVEDRLRFLSNVGLR
jgi:hypothetical protein